MIDRRATRRQRCLSAGTVAVGAMTAGYHEVLYDDGDQYKGEWNAEGKVHGGACTAIGALTSGLPFAPPSLSFSHSLLAFLHHSHTELAKVMGGWDAYSSTSLPLGAISHAASVLLPRISCMAMAHDSRKRTRVCVGVAAQHKLKWEGGGTSAPCLPHSQLGQPRHNSPTQSVPWPVNKGCCVTNPR
jgi:hypothetical protein